MTEHHEQTTTGSGLVPVVRGPDMVALAEELVASASDRGIALTGELYLAVRQREVNRPNPTGRIAGWKDILNVLSLTYGDRLGIN